jgi:hypothetical protein
MCGFIYCIILILSYFSSGHITGVNFGKFGISFGLVALDLFEKFLSATLVVVIIFTIWYILKQNKENCGIIVKEQVVKAVREHTDRDFRNGIAKGDQKKGQKKRQERGERRVESTVE